MRAELAEVAETATFALSDAELKRLLVEATAVAARVEELQARLVAEADGRDQARHEGCTSTTAWVRTTTGLSGAAAARLSAGARELFAERVAPTRIAWAAGRLTGEQALVIAEAINTLSTDVDPDRVLAAQLNLIDQAGEHRLEDLRRLANRLIEVVDPETADAILAEQLGRRSAKRWSRPGCGSPGVATAPPG
jgi:hypothetical protein